MSAPSPQTVLVNGVEKYGNFDLIRRFKLDITDVVVSKWRSRVTGLSIVHLDYEAPIVNGYFVVATEIFNDSGCPHTLEHLVFMGSEKYPFKGIIDHLANRGFSNGTNAWTDDDLTAYTVSTAGGQGFLQLLPAYVDHILYPTLTTAGFITEVHHIDPKGHDSGVVYSEMQGRENTASDLISLRSKRLLEPPESAYRSETGGLMAALRVLTIEQIREYHHTYYVPHNLNLIVAGKLMDGTSSLLEVVQEQVEPNLIAHKQDQGPRPPGWKRPFVDTPSANRRPIPKTIKEIVEFPEKDESMGEVMISFLGPPVNHFLERVALDILGMYLTSSPTAPLNKEYVEIESPLCSYFYFDEDARATFTYLSIYIASVPSEHLNGFDESLRASFKRIVEGGIDMERMTMIIDRDERQLRSKLESDKGDTYSSAIITDFLYGAEDGSELAEPMNEINHYNQLRIWDSRQWTDLLQKYYLEPESVVVYGKPSAALAKKLERDEKARITAQVKRLGSEGLKQAEKKLQEAKAEHETPIPTKVLNDFPVPDVKSIAWIPVQSVQEKGKGRQSPLPAVATDLSKHISADGSPLQFFIQYDHVQSDFVTVHAWFSLANLPSKYRPYISTYLYSIFSSPVRKQSGERLTHEEIINKLDKETVSYDVSLGIGNTFSELIRVSIRVEVAQYETAVAWLKDIVYGIEFDKDRLQVTTAKLYQSLPELKRDGNTVLSAVWADLMFSDKSTPRATGVLNQSNFIPQLIGRLQESPNDVIAEFEEIRKLITNPSGIRFSVTGNVLSLPNPRSIWGKYFSDVLPEVELSPVPVSYDTLSDVGRTPGGKAIVMSLPTIESSFVTYSTQSIRGFCHPAYPAVRVALEVLNATEGYLWRYIRGSGLAYGAYISLDLEAGLLSFSLDRSSNSAGAFREASRLLHNLVNGAEKLEETTIDAAKSSIVFGVTKNVATPARAAMMSFSNQALREVTQDHQLRLLEKYQSIKRQDVIDALKTYFLSLFNPSSSVAVVVTAPSKSQTTREDLQDAGYEVELRSLQVDEDECDAFTSEGSDGFDTNDDSSVESHQH